MTATLLGLPAARRPAMTPSLLIDAEQTQKGVSCAQAYKAAVAQAGRSHPEKKRSSASPEDLAVPGRPLLRGPCGQDPGDRERGTRPFSREPGGDAGRLTGSPTGGRGARRLAGERASFTRVCRGPGGGRPQLQAQTGLPATTSAPTVPLTQKGRRGDDGQGVSRQRRSPLFRSPRSPEASEATALRSPEAGHPGPSADLASRPEPAVAPAPSCLRSVRAQLSSTLVSVLLPRR
ncbi:unnamed protein product [Rangifer tarandus platyrhynchus]|uniref:Uncharacterized protein n=1 Tax=Rangifer tarandus platyrhynchus TaxID=3082113 RepID=A0AC59YRZ8_RANTA